MKCKMGIPYPSIGGLKVLIILESEDGNSNVTTRPKG